MTNAISIRLASFDAWFRETWGTDAALIEVAGQLREKNAGPSSEWLPIMRVRAPVAASVEFLLPTKPPTAAGDGPAHFNSGSEDEWWNAWAPMMAGAVLLHPVCDPVRLQDILHETRRLRFCCDTSALASGVLAWLLAVLDGRADAVTSAVVDREVATWSDQNPEMWKAKDVGGWKTRTVFLLARRVLEGAPAGVVVDRMSPDQNALVVAKGRGDNGTNGSHGPKLPDADILMIELARRLIREQPPTARMIYLTGDRNHARSAVGALGAENVFYAAADSDLARAAVKAKYASRCWWRPDGNLGALVTPPVSSLFSSLLAGFRFLRLQTPEATFIVSMLTSIKNGAPSDWHDPWIRIERVVAASTAETVLPPDATDGAASAHDQFAVDLPPLESLDPEPLDVLGTAVEVSEPAATPTGDDWLLPPRPSDESVDVSPSVRLAPKAVFWVLWRALSGEAPAETISAESLREAVTALTALGAIGGEHHAGDRLAVFRQLWMDGDLDGFHAEFLRVPGYRAALEGLRANPGERVASRAQAQIAMARALGQVARLDRAAGVTRVGDRPVRRSELLTALRRWTDEPSQAVSVARACELAAVELGLTPARFETSMRRLWEQHRGIPYDGETGGEVNPGFAERVVALGPAGYDYREVEPGALTFGRKGPIRFIVRKG